MTQHKLTNAETYEYIAEFIQIFRAELEGKANSLLCGTSIMGDYFKFPYVSSKGICVAVFEVATLQFRWLEVQIPSEDALSLQYITINIPTHL